MRSQHLVLIPGLNCTARLYSHQLERLATGNAVMIADQTSAPSMAELAERVLASAPERFALAGLSMGGYLAFEILRRAPERVERLALLDTSARPDAPERSEARRKQVGEARAGRFRDVLEALWPNLVHPARHEDAVLHATHIEMAEAIGVEGFARQIEAIIGEADSRPLLAGIQVPTLVLVGEQDQLTPVELNKEIADGIPGARLEVVPDCGHLSTLEKPATVTRLMAEWLGA